MDGERETTDFTEHPEEDVAWDHLQQHGQRGEELIRFAGTISRPDLEEMERIIDEECERIDHDEGYGVRNTARESARCVIFDAADGSSLSFSGDIALSTLDLAGEMAAARARRAEATARSLREARVQTIRGAVRPGSTRAEVEERARSFYPRLSEELLEEVVNLVCDSGRGPAPGTSEG